MEDTQAAERDGSCRPATATSKGHDFAVTVDVRDDCDVKKVEITVDAAGADRGRDGAALRVGSDRASTARRRSPSPRPTAAAARAARRLQVTAPDDARELGPTESDGAGGCTVASGAFGAAGLVPSLAMFAALQRQATGAAGCAASPARSRGSASPSPPTNRASYEWPGGGGAPIRARAAPRRAAAAGAPTRSRPTAAGRRAPRATDRIATSLSSSKA